MPGSMTDFESPSPFDEWGYFQDPVFPITKRNSRRNKIVGKCELVVQEMKKEPEKGAHKKQGFDLSQTLALLHMP